MSTDQSAQERAWWQERQENYLQRPEIQQEIAARQQEIDERNAEIKTAEDELERRLAAGEPGAQEALNRHYNADALVSDPPEPNAQHDPAEWEAFYREVRGVNWPLHAQYQAEKHSIDAWAPPDVGGMAANYYEANEPSISPDELSAEAAGMSLEELLAERRAEEREMYRDVEAF